MEFSRCAVLALALLLLFPVSAVLPLVPVSSMKPLVPPARAQYCPPSWVPLVTTYTTPSGGTMGMEIPGYGLGGFGDGSYWCFSAGQQVNISANGYGAPGATYFNHWDSGGGVQIPDLLNYMTYMTVGSGNGWVRAYYSANPSVAQVWLTPPDDGASSITVSGSCTYCRQGVNLGTFMDSWPAVWRYLMPGTYTITANVPSGKQFVQWYDDGGIPVANRYSKTTTMTLTGSSFGSLGFAYSEPTYSYTATVSGLGSGVTTTLYLDGGWAATLANGGSHQFTSLQGSHTISVDPSTAAGAPAGTQYSIDSPNYSIQVSDAGSHTFTYHTEYQLTMNDVNPSGSGTTNPTTGQYWYNSGTSVPVSASPNTGYQFLSWSDSGAQSHNVNMNAPKSLTANFQVQQVTMTVSYTVVGGGSGYSAPIFYYTQGGAQHQYTLTGTAHAVTCDGGTYWSVDNPLGGSTGLQQWYSSQSTSGYASTQTIQFSYSHQYYLTMQVTPSGGGTTIPTSGWQNSGSTVTLSATANSGFSWTAWTGSGTGSITGTTNPCTNCVTMNNQVTETAAFAAIPIGMSVSYAVNSGGSGYSTPVFHYVQGGSSNTYTLTTTSTVINVDGGSTWSVTSNPLDGSNSGERWYSVQTLSGTAATGTYVFTFQHQYALTMQSSPSGGGTPSPVSGWQNAGAAVNISATPNTGYSFASWTGTGSGSYSGSIKDISVTMSSTITETANFQQSVTMTVSYSVDGGGTGYSPPVFNYTQGGQIKQYTLTITPTGIQCDTGSSWSVASNPLGGSGASEQWYSSDVLSGTASVQTLLFSFQHQYYLTMQASPSGGGTLLPASGWQNAGVSSNISASTSSGYMFQSWTGTGSGSYTGTNNPSSVTMSSSTTETANFIGGGTLVTMTISYTVVGGGSGYSVPIYHYVQGGSNKQYTLTGTPTGVQCDSGSAWSVTSNPLGGSGASEQWYSSSTLSGTASVQTLVFSFQHQYYLTMQANPSGDGSVLPATGWQNAGASISISASAGSGYVFQAWTGLGIGAYTGISNPVSVTMSSAISETAGFGSSSAGTVTMTVSYAIVGGGSGYSTPTFSYVQGGIVKQSALNQTATGVQCDSGSAWSVTSNPLGGSGASEQWYSSSTLSGTASVQTLVFSFQHQYYLTMQANPSGDGSVLPATGWQNADASISVSASAGSGYVFQSWTGTGAGSYSGTDNPSSVTMSSAITETAGFGSSSAGTVTMTVSYAIVGGGSGYSAPTFNCAQGGFSENYTLTGTPTGIQCDSGSAWAVTPNPLGGSGASGASEQWYSSSTLSGTASARSITFSFQHQYLLTIQISPSDGGTAIPDSGWQSTGASVAISASVNSGYAFQSWTGSGQGSYTGSNNPSSVTMSEPITETAYFSAGQLGTASITVSYTLVGSGSPVAPVFNYIQGGQSRQSELTQDPTAIQVDSGSPWTVASNPLVGSNNMERWYATQSLSGTASLQTLTFTFQHQYYLITQGSAYYGSVDPASGWQNAGTQIQITVTPQPGQTFQAWVGSGSGSYSGTDNPATVTINAPITEVANFVSQSSQSQTGVCKFASGGQAVLGGGVYYYGRPEANTAQLTQLPFILLGTVGPGALLNRRGWRRLNKHGGHRGGISKLVASLILIVLVAGGIAGISLYYSTIASGAASHQDLDTMGSVIKVNTADDSGSVYLKIHNVGMGTVQVAAITVNAHAEFTVNFTDAVGRVQSGWTCTCEGSQGVGIAGSSPNGYLVIPPGATVSILTETSVGVATYFTPGVMYEVWLMPLNGPGVQFNVPTEAIP